MLGGRLHPAVVVLWPFTQLVSLAFVALAGDVPAIAAAVLVPASVLAGVVRWRRFSWRLEGGALVIEQGLLQRRRRVLPVERVQSVDLVRRLRHRLLGVVEVRVEAVGADATEGRLDALAPADAQRLRTALLAARAGATGSAPVGATASMGAPGDTGATVDARGDAARETGEELVRMRWSRLVQAGLTGGRVGVAAALLGGAQQLAGDRVGDRVGDLFRLPDTLGVRGVVGLAVAVLVGAFLLSVVATTVAYWDFTLVRDGDELRVRRGLLEQRLDTLPLSRVQAVRVEENLLRRPFGLAAVKVDVAGRAGGDDARDTGLLLPLGSRGEAHALVARLLAAPGVAGGGPNTRAAPELTPMPARARRRRLVRAAVATTVPTAVAVAVWGRAGLAVALVGLIAVPVALDAYRALGSAVVAAGALGGGGAGDVVVARAGVLVRRTAYVPVARLQALALRSAPFQRRAHLATLDLGIARSPGVWRGPQLVDIDAGAGAAVLCRLSAAAGSRSQVMGTAGGAEGGGGVVGGGFEPP